MVTAILLLVIGGLSWLYYTESRDRARDVARLGEFHARDLTYERERHERELMRTIAVFEQQLKAQAAGQTATMEAAIRLATIGTPTQEPVQIEEREVDAHTRLSRMVSDQAVERGIDALRENYRAIGVQLSDEELRDEAMLLLSVGTMPQYPKEPQQVGVPIEAQ
jgi:hypothetical protein